MKWKKILYIVLSLVLIFKISAFSQGSKKKIQRLAENYFDNEQFEKALPLFLKLDSLEPNKFETKYYIGVCYLNSEHDKTKGIPYLEYALKNGEKYLPSIIFYDLAKLYHLNYEFDKAIEMLNTFFHRASKSDIYYKNAEQLYKYCTNAKEIIQNQQDIEIEKLNSQINTVHSEIKPFISADESKIFFTRIYYETKSNIEFETVKKIYVANKNKDYDVSEVIIGNLENSKVKIELAGVSPDGEVLFFAIGNDNNSDIYACKLSDNKCDKLIRLPDIINSPYNETSISVSPDGRTYYFSSNRPGGYGGKDIYRAIMDDNNNWSIIENLGPSVNTEFDEDAPFIHPDGKTLYFSSKGHNSMGGYDIFYTTNISKNEWKYPTNMGAPINTPSDDIGFVISADGNSAYFTSSKNSLTKYDIYKAILHKTIPLTLVKGTILGGQPPKPIKARIRVIDKETQQIIKYVYNPNPKTGKYLMIFPPNKNYEMLIEAEGYLPQLVNIFVPNQTYFYELYQEIFLKQIKINEKDTAIGQQIRISNIFYDIYNTAITDSILYVEEQKRKEHNDKLLKLIENIIVETDSLNLSGIQISNADEEKISKDKIMAQRYNRLIENIETAIEKTDSTFLKILDANAIYNSVTDKTFFYGVEDKDNQLTKIIIGNDTLYALPSVNTAKPLVINTPSVIQLELDTIAKIPQKKEFDFRSVPENKRRYVYINYIFYKSGKADIEKKYFSMLKNILELIKYNDDLGIEINGCADPIGDDQKNLELSKQRANNVYKYFIDNFISPRRFIVTAKGEIKSEKYEDLQQLRRTEIKLFEVK